VSEKEQEKRLVHMARRRVGGKMLSQSVSGSLDGDFGVGQFVNEFLSWRRKRRKRGEGDA